MNLAPLLAAISLNTALPQDPQASNADLARALAEVRAQVDALRAAKDADAARLRDLEARYQSLLEEVEARGASGGAGKRASWTDRMTLDGYGEIQGRFTQGDDEDFVDLTRLVAYLGYRFEDWLLLHSETELEHGMAADGVDGEVLIEQLYVDYLIGDAINLRAGRVLTPIGIVNERHEPTTFNGVLRPDFDRSIIPTTWSFDGIGIHGRLCDQVKYQLYAGASLDGSGFDSVDGIRGGRQEQLAGVHEPAVTGRLDWFPRESMTDLRFGLSFFGGGLDNGLEGANPGVDADLEIYSVDAEYSVGRWDFRGVYAYEKINGAADIGNNVASAIDGYYVEAARHILPDSWKTGRLQKADAVAFVRYDDLDTQASMPEGVSRDPAGDREIVTMGLSFFPTEGFVLKADYQIRDDDTPAGLPERFNVGLGWSF